MDAALISLLQHDPKIATVLAIVMALVAGSSAVAKAAETIASLLKAKSKRAAKVDAWLLKAIAALEKVQKVLGVPALHPAKAPDAAAVPAPAQEVK